MLQLKNKTPFQANIAVFPNEQGVDTLYVVVKGTFTLGQTIELADKQRAVVLADEYWGEPGTSSLKYASEAHLSKPSTDVVVIGEACVPDRRPVTQLDVSIAVADRKKTLRVFGDRRWEKGLFGMRMSEAAPFENMPLVYERSFGGMHVVNRDKNEVVFEPRNPVGRGFAGKRKKDEIDGMKLPNLEDPTSLITKPSHKPAPACCGFVSPSWEPRKSFAGTYDDVWQKTRAPYLPDDFRSQYFNAAHPDLMCPRYLRGGEPVEVMNMSPCGPLRFTLPTCQVEAAVRVAGKTTSSRFNLETVLIEPSVSTLCLTWRAAVPCDKKVLKVEQVEIALQNLVLPRMAA
jgi:hypothetical protein